TGDTIAASADPLFMRPLAVPEYLPAMSIGIDHIGPITISAEKSDAVRHGTTTRRSCVPKIGSRNMNAPRKPATTTSRRALCRSPVRRRIASLTTPPSRSPATPAENTADANNAERLRSSLYASRKNDGSQLRYTHSVHA